MLGLNSFNLKYCFSFLFSSIVFPKVVSTLIWFKSIKKYIYMYIYKIGYYTIFKILLSFKKFTSLHCYVPPQSLCIIYYVTFQPLSVTPAVTVILILGDVDVKKKNNKIIASVFFSYSFSSFLPWCIYWLDQSFMKVGCGLHHYHKI